MSCYPKSLFLGRIFHINRPAIGVPPPFFGETSISFKLHLWRAMTWHDMTKKYGGMCDISEFNTKNWRCMDYSEYYVYVYVLGGLVHFIILHTYIYIYVYVIYTIFSILDTKTRWWVVLHLPAGGNGAWPGDLQHGGSCVRCPRGQGTDGAPLEKP